MKNIISTIAAAGLLFGSTGIASAETHIKQRKENQQARIANGVKNGSLSPNETAHLENKESRLNREIRSDRQQNGGNLTNNEKTQINRQQNHLSKDIYQTKHDGPNQ